MIVFSFGYLQKPTAISNNNDAKNTKGPNSRSPLGDGRNYP